MSIDVNILERTYFYFDKPVEYKLDNYILKIYPINVCDSEYFLSSINLFTVDKNATPSVEIIQMSYLQFIIDILLTQNKSNLDRFVNLLTLCLHMKAPKIELNESGKPLLVEGNNEYSINGQQFEDIRRIILYQNLLGYDDTYINPDLKKAMAEMDELKNKGYENLTLERKIAIITAHTGISKKEQLEMTYRSHSLLFEEVFGEVEFTTIRPVALFSGNGDKLEHWIVKKKKNKMDNYVTKVDEYAKSMGSNQNAIKNVQGQLSNEYLQKFNNFNH